MSEGVCKWWLHTWNFIDNRMVVRRLLLVGTAWLVADSYLWCKSFADQSQRDGLQIAAIIAAVTGPVTLLLKFVLDNYGEARK